MRRGRVIEEIFFDRVAVEPGDGAQLAGDGGPGAAAALQVTGEALDVGAADLEKAEVVLVALRRPRDYADLAAGAAGGGRGGAGKVGIIRGLRGRLGAGRGAGSARVSYLGAWFGRARVLLGGDRHAGRFAWFRPVVGPSR